MCSREPIAGAHGGVHSDALGRIATPGPSRRSTHYVSDDVAARRRVAIKLKRTWHNGTRELVFEPREFLERPSGDDAAAGEQRAHLPWVLAPRARWRHLVVAYGRPRRTRSSGRVGGPPTPSATCRSQGTAHGTALELVGADAPFANDVLSCPRCGG